MRDATGTWFTDNYSYGESNKPPCLRLSITGDINYDKEIERKLHGRALGTQIAKSDHDDCENPSAEPPVAAAADDDTRQRFNIEVSIAKVAYSITGQCNSGAENFCLNRAAQCQLLNRLILKDGEQQ